MQEENDQPIAFLNIVKILSDYRSFEKWLKEHHKITEHEQFLIGYKYLITISTQWLIETLFSYDLFRLKEDRTLTRAHFVGIKLEDVPNSCEKTVFCKNVWLLTKDIRRVQSWNEMTNKKLKKITNLLPYILDDCAETRLNSKKIALKYVTMFYAYLFLLDTSYGHPLAALGSFFEIQTSRDYLERVYAGYVYGLQFLWYKILSKTEFEKSPLKDLHRAEEVFGKESQEYMDIMLDSVESEDEEIDLRKGYKWLCLDRFFKKVQLEVIRPMEREIYKIITDSDGAVFNLKKIDRLAVKELLIPSTEEEHVKNNDSKSIIKRLDVDFYWYPILYDAAKVFVVNRSLVFIAILKGLALIFDEQVYDDKILVKIIKHPIGKNKHDVTFAILVGYSGAFMDDSRWLVLHDCATDYSGGGRLTYQRMHSSIKKLGKRVEVKTHVVAKHDFETYLREKNISGMENTSVHKLEAEFGDFIGKSKGKLFESVVYKWIRKHYRFDYYDGDLCLNGEEIDCYGKKENVIELFECKMSLHSVTDIVKQLERKSKALEKEYPDCEIVKNVVIFENLSPTRMKELKKKKIHVRDDFKTTIKTDRAFDGTRRRTMSIFDYPE